MKFKIGDTVKIIEREQTPADVKSGTFYPFYCGLYGTVDRMYEDEVCILVDHSSLPKGVLDRHIDIQESMKKKWLEGLSNEARNRLSAEEKRFTLSYTLLVQAVDLEAAEPGMISPEKCINDEPAPKEVDSNELDQHEEAFLEARRKQIEESQSRN
jgi:ribosomal protein L21E